VASDLLLEIGTEEMPAGFILPALEDLRRAIAGRLEAVRLAHGEVRSYGTPRRLAIKIKDVADFSADLSREVVGPSAKAAFDRDGKATQAAEKFASGLKVPLQALRRVQTPKGEYVSAVVEERGRPAGAILPEILSSSAHGIGFRKSMRWGDVEQTFARPVHWLVALLGEEVLPLVFGDVKSGRTTRGHRFLAPSAIELRRPADYERAMEKAHVIPDFARRKALLDEGLRAAAQRVGAQVISDPDLLEQVTNLVEEPHAVLGSFDARHLDLPREVLIQEMKSHQRYFSLADSSGKLVASFIAVSNTPVRDERASLIGYERVLRARLADGRFFFDEDRKTPLGDRVDKLRRVVWQGKLGSYAEKVERIRALALFLARMTGKGDSNELRQTIERGAILSKADLVTGMVGEFPELQGAMGREYALASGESPEVALAIFEHYLPRGANDALPTGDAGALIGIADRLDSLCGIFAIGKIPTGAADPFALRRACLGVINIALGRGYRFSLSAAVSEALQLLGPKIADIKRKPSEPGPGELVLDFFRGRLKALWAESHRADAVEAVLSAGFDDLLAAQKRVQALSQLVGRADFVPLAVAFKRVANIVEKQGKDVAGQIDPARLIEEPERALHHSLLEAGNAVQRYVATDDYAGALREIAGLKPAVDAFFDKVMVMAEDKSLRANRISLLRQIRALFNQVADFSKVHIESFQ
jgi:glycyl-tRNA synthetase beta chain